MPEADRTERLDEWHTLGAKRPRLPWKGVAKRSESFKIMIAGGNHSAVKRWLSDSETGGVCSSTELYKKPLSQPTAASSSSALSICTPPRRLQLLNLSGAPLAKPEPAAIHPAAQSRKRAGQLLVEP